jgi:membrane-bound lytic murein transglycosylase D
MNADSIARWQPPKPVVVEEEWETYWLQHRVGKGETLGRIAGKYHVTIVQLKKWNKLRSDKIRKGQVLKIEKRKKVVRELEEIEIQNGHEIQNHDENDNVNQNQNENQNQNQNQEHTQSPLPTPQSPLPSPQSSLPTPKSPRYYTVKSGDSLWSIAKKYPGVTEQDLMKWNKCGANIRPGQKLVIR